MQQSRQRRVTGGYLKGHTYGSPWRGNPTQQYPGMTEAIKAVKRQYKTVTHSGGQPYGDDEWQQLLNQEPG